MVDERILVLGTLGREMVHAKEESSGICFGGTAYHAIRGFRLLKGVSPVVVSIIGNDIEIDDLAKEFPAASHALELQKCEDKPSFYWEALYEDGSSSARTIKLENEILSKFSANWELIASKYPKLKFCYLAAFDPDQQARCAMAFESSFIVSETLNYWVQVDRNAVLKVVEHSNGLVLTENEVKMLWQIKPQPDKQSKELIALMKQFSLEFLTVTFDERGSHTYHNEGSFFQPALRCEEIDPTGAGNVFTSALTGFLAMQAGVNAVTISQAVAIGSVLASFQVRGFSSLAIDALSIVEMERLARDLGTRAMHFPS